MSDLYVLYACLTCQPHSTLDHGEHGKGACLITDCLCMQMVPGDVFKKRAMPRLPKDEARKLAAERGKSVHS